MRQTISISKFCRKRKIAAYAQAIKALAVKKAEDIVAVDITKYSSYADFIVICSATSSKHAQTLADEIAGKSGKRAVLEGYDSGEWILADLGGLVVHIFCGGTREDYDLEGLWHDSPLYLISDMHDNATDDRKSR